MRAPRFGRLHLFPSWLSLLVVALLPWPRLLHASDDFAAPTPSMIDQLRQQHSAKDWLRITTATNRLELRVEKVEDDGLHGFQARKRTSLPPMLPWSSIQRIDRRESRFRIGQTLGLALGAVLGGFIGGSSESDPVPGALIGVAIGGAVGGGLGATMGDAMVHERPLYVASPSPTPNEPLSTTSAEIPAKPVPAGISVDKVRARITPGDLVRVTGNFGQFSGQIAGIDEHGLSGLQPDPAFNSTLPPSEPLAWTEIERIDRWGGRSRSFAVTTGLVTGVVFGVLGTLIVSVDADWSGTTATAGHFVGAAVGGFAVGAAAGAGLGALLGGMFPGWSLVHRRKH